MKENELRAGKGGTPLAAESVELERRKLVWGAAAFFVSGCAAGLKAEDIESIAQAATTGTVLAGVGSPEGVVAAAVGTIYEQTDATNGRMLWCKRTGTSTTGWALMQTGPTLFNVRDFGAKADPTVDDAPAFRSAVTAASVAGGVVFVPPGTYYLKSVDTNNAAFSITTSKVSLLGCGTSSLLQAAGTVTFSGGLVCYLNAADFFVQDIWFDMNAKPDTNGVVSVTFCDRFTIDRCRITSFTRFGLCFTGPRQFLVTNNSVERASIANTQNEGLLVSSAGRQSMHGRICRNYFRNSGLDLCCTVCDVDGNTIEGFGFGGGITTEANANSAYYRIRHNYIAGGSGIDENVTVCLGIENWAPFSVIQGNVIVSNDGSAIDNGGWSSIVVDNYCLNNCGYSGWSATGNPAINSRYIDATNNGSNSIIAGNVTLDTRTGTAKGHSYGYSDQSASLSEIVVADNHFLQSRTGIANILASRTRFSGDVLETKVSWNIGSVNASATATTSLTLSGATPGDFVLASLEGDAKNCIVSANCNVANNVKVAVFNGTGAAQSLGTLNLRVRVAKPKDAPLF